MDGYDAAVTTDQQHHSSPAQFLFMVTRSDDMFKITSNYGRTVLITKQRLALSSKNDY